MSGKGNNEQVTAVSMADWLKRKANQVVNDTLPSGLAVRRKTSVSVESLALKGQLPLTLVSELTEQSAVEIDVGDVVANMGQYIQLIDAVFTAAMVSPKIGQTTDLSNDTLALAEFEDELPDKMYIMEQVLGATNALKPFREEHGANGAAASSGQRVRKKTK